MPVDVRGKFLYYLHPGNRWAPMSATLLKLLPGGRGLIRVRRIAQPDEDVEAAYDATGTRPGTWRFCYPQKIDLKDGPKA